MLRNSVFSLITTVVRLATGLVMFIVLAHIWGPERFGVFMYPYAIAAILVRLVDYGFLLQAARDVGKRPAEAHDIMSRALGTKLLLTASAFVLLAFVAPTLPQGHHYGSLTAVLLADAVASSFVLFLCVPLRAFGRFDVEARISTTTNAVVFIAVVGIVLAGRGPIAAAVVMALTRIICLVPAWSAYRKVVGHPPRAVTNGASVRRSLIEGLPFGVHATVGMLLMQAETLMIEHYLGTSPVGLYQAGMRVLLGALLLGDALNSVYLSDLARVTTDRDAVMHIGRRMTRHLLLIGLVAFAATLGLGPWGVRILFGVRYAALAPILPFFGFLMFIRYGGISYGTLLTLADRQAVRVAAVCGVLLLSIGLNAVLIPRYALNGAIAAALLAHVALYGVYVWATHRDLGSFLVEKRSSALLVLGGVAALSTVLLPDIDATARLGLAMVLALAGIAAGLSHEERTRLRNLITRASTRVGSASAALEDAGRPVAEVGS